MRKNYLDNIRNFTVFLVVIYHIIFMYNGICSEGVIGPFADFQWQDSIQYLLYPWFMVILFIVAGVSSRFYLENHNPKEFSKARTKKLLLPSTAGLFVFWWIQGFINMKISGAYEKFPPDFSKAALFIITAVSGTGVLWFTQMLWLFSMILLIVKKIDKNDKLYNFCSKANVLVVLLLGIPAFFCCQILNTPVVSVYRFGIYGFAFFCGYFVFSHEEVIKKISKFSFIFAICSVILGIIHLKNNFGKSYVEGEALKGIIPCSYMWFTCLSIFGIFSKFFDKTNDFLTFVNKKSYSFYLFHYLCLSSVALFLKRFPNLPYILNYMIIGIAAFAGSYLLDLVIPKIPFLSWLICGKHDKIKKCSAKV